MSTKKDPAKTRLNTTQSVLYGKEFQKADRAAGYKQKTIGR